MAKPKVEKQTAEILRQQVIDLDSPGTVLADFQSLLDFIGPDGVRSTGKYHFLPLDRLRELDERMRKPLRPRLERPQQRSFPHLNGLYLLLRATQLGVAEGEGKKTGKLVLNPPMLVQWQSLNPTERYFNLLEAWLRLGREESLGERGSGWGNTILRHAGEIWCLAGDAKLTVAQNPQIFEYFTHSPLYACALALFELFGLIELERGQPAEGENWHVRDMKYTAFGKALMDAIFDQVAGITLLFQREEGTGFGAWQPRLREFFPDWRSNLAFPEPEFRDGVYYFKIRLGRPWRRIAIPGDNDLEDLARWIIRAFDFGGNHLYEFSFADRDGSTVTVAHPYLDDAEVHTDEYSVGYLPLAEGGSMKFRYDFGTSSVFDVKLEKVEPPNRRMKGPTIVESHGDSPPEYESEDD